MKSTLIKSALGQMFFGPTFTCVFFLASLVAVLGLLARQDQALLVGLAPADSRSIVLALVIEDGGVGGTTAAPVARQIFDYWMLERNEGALAPDETYVSIMNQQVLGYGNADSN